MKITASPIYRLALLALMALVLPAQAEIYKFVDDKGQVTCTNMPRPGAKPLAIPDMAVPGKPDSADARAAGKAASKATGKIPTPGYFPKVDEGTQRKRDDMRRQLLVEEMRSEERNLSAARRALADGSRQPGADVKKLVESVCMHEKNIEMLNKELSHIR
jgi:hypothetical protein